MDEANPVLKGYLSCTKQYMAPELQREKIDFNVAKADVFSLGVLLVNFLTGQYPFEQVFSDNTCDKLNDLYQTFMDNP